MKDLKIQTPARRMCSIPGCDRKHEAKGMCKRHHERIRRGYGIEPKCKYLGLPAAEKYSLYVIKSPDPDACWGWSGTFDKGGYGTMSEPGHRGPIRAHRYSYEIHIGSIPKGLWVLHSCNNPPCTNPRHLRSGYGKENAEDRWDAGHQKNGTAHHWCHIPDDKILEIREAKGTTRGLAKQFGISYGHVSNIKRGAQRRAILGNMPELGGKKKA